MALCIDVSEYQKVDWKTVSNSGCKYAVLRSVKKNLRIDTQFENHYKNARSNGVKVGIYIYSYASDVAYAKKEAEAVVKLLAGRKLDLPIFYDLETDVLRKSSKATIQSIANTFKAVVEKAGYDFGIYCDESFYNTNDHFVGYPNVPFWIAKYGKNDGKQHNLPKIKHDLYAHQYTSKGRVAGVTGDVDVSELYVVSKVESAKPEVSTPVLSKTVKYYGYVTANALNVRTWAGTENKTVSFSPLKNGAKVAVLDEVKDKAGNSWFYIKYGNKCGFCSAKYISKTK